MEQPVNRDDLGRFVPGQSGNPRGRPRVKPFTDAIHRVIEGMGEEQLDRLVQEQFNTIMEGGPTAPALLKLVMDRTDGPVVQQTEVKGDMRSYIVLEAMNQGEPDMPEGLLPSADVLQLGEGEADDAEAQSG